MLHQNSFRVDRYLMALGLKTQWDSVRCFFGEKWPVFPLTLAQHEQPDQMLFESLNNVRQLCCTWKRVLSQESVEGSCLCCEQVEDKDWMTGGKKCQIQHWLHISPNCVPGLRSHVRFRFLTWCTMVHFLFSIEIW